MGIRSRLLSTLLAAVFAVTPVIGMFGTVSADEKKAEYRGGLEVSIEEIDNLPQPTVHAEIKGTASEADKKYWWKMSSNVYYDRFSEAEKAVYNKLDSAALKYLLSDSDISDFSGVQGTENGIYVDLDGVDTSSVNLPTIILMFLNSNPQYFYLQTLARYGSGGIILYAYSDFVSGTARAAARDTIKNKVNEYVSAASKYSLPEQKEHVVFELMCKNIEYVTGAPYNQSLYSAVLGKTVCAGYMHLFTAVMNLCGITCGPVTSDDHGWNIILLHGNWYYVDVTGGDQEWGVYYYYYNTNTTAAVMKDMYYLYIPVVSYDCLEDYYYSNLYFEVGGVTYFIANADTRLTRMAVPVSEPTSFFPSSVTYNGKTYAVIKPVLDGWYKLDGQWYYFKNNANPLKGWNQINNKWYYFEATGAMVTGWRQSGSNWYYFSGSGAMVTDWQQLGDKWYYFGSDGAMLTGWQKISGKWYYFEASGAMKTGWYMSGGKWYYFSGSGSMVTGWQEIGGAWYYFDSDGSMFTGWLKSGNKWYYLQSSGVMKTGWYLSGSSWYYFDNSGVMVTGSKTISGKTYNFNSNGVCTNP